ncbi:hypothetical protein IPH25_03135 [bacterium]|nr:MAG: hypothetical protein IPG37_00125 [bacterium]QQR61461.1 MAG: hypothetical protein IPH25_03135 [bacterium]QQR63013.1 MAG: hypothetical protein IPH67_00875 [bacterium]
MIRLLKKRNFYIINPMKTEKSGYILVLTMMMMGALSAIVVFMFNRGMSVIPFISTVIAREKAKMVAFGGVQIAQALLSDFTETTSHKKDFHITQDQLADKNNKAAKEQTVSVEQQFLQKIMPIINRFQTFVLKENIDGVDGTVEVLISCEDGKINLNKFFDFNSKKFLGEGLKQNDSKIILQTIIKKFEALTKTAELFPALERFLQKQQSPLDDVSQLFEIPEFAPLKDKLFIAKTNDKNLPLTFALTDLFTVHSWSAAVEPWLLSYTLLHTLGIEDKNTIEQRKKSNNEWLKNFKKTSSWPATWNTSLKNIYQKEFNSLPKGIDAFFTTNHNPKFFSVLVIATVDKVIQKVFAIIERVNRSHNNQIVYDSIIRKFYIL